MIAIDEAVMKLAKNLENLDRSIFDELYKRAKELAVEADGAGMSCVPNEMLDPLVDETCSRAIALFDDLKSYMFFDPIECLESVRMFLLDFGAEVFTWKQAETSHQTAIKSTEHLREARDWDAREVCSRITH